MENSMIGKCARVCSNHFQQLDYTISKAGKKTLKANATPYPMKNPR